MAQKRLSNLKTKQQERQISSLINAIQSLQDNKSNSLDTDSDSSDNRETEKHPLTKVLTDALSDLVIKHKIDKESNHEIKNNNTSEIANSGNSDIDIKINIDLSSIAFAVLYSLFASNQLSKEELETALNRLEVLKHSE